MKKLIDQLWSGEPVVILGILGVVAGGLATAAIIPIWIPPIVVGIATLIQRQKVTPTKHPNTLR